MNRIQDQIKQRSKNIEVKTNKKEIDNNINKDINKDINKVSKKY